MIVWRLIRTITSEECSWINDDEIYKKGEILFQFTGYTYGCVTSSGEAIRRDPLEDHFCEIPKSALKPIGIFVEIGK